MSQTNRSVSLPATELADFRRYADQNGQSLAAWLLSAARRERARQSAHAYAALLADPDVQRELAPLRALQDEHRSRIQALARADAA